MGAQQNLCAENCVFAVIQLVFQLYVHTIKVIAHALYRLPLLFGSIGKAMKERDRKSGRVESRQRPLRYPPRLTQALLIDDHLSPFRWMRASVALA